MANRTFKAIKGKRIQYKLNHHLVGETHPFDSWMTLCEYVLDIAEEEARKILNTNLDELICKISDEIMSTAEEYEPTKKF